ncbi:MAG: 30S ribosomal protein S6 [Lewinellaceae bacterium]|nr:30S ribosomal protein S6 [Lewinellaceae bacterium]
MNHYEVTFIVDPVLSGDEIKATAQTYVDQLTNVGCTIVHVDEMGLRQLAYPINRRSSGIYYCVEFSNENGEFMDNLELSLRRDERIMRFLTVRLDKYGVKYNEDKRNGLIGKRKKKSAEPAKEETPAPAPAPKAAPVKESPAEVVEAAEEPAAPAAPATPDVVEENMETPPPAPELMDEPGLEDQDEAVAEADEEEKENLD